MNNIKDIQIKGGFDCLNIHLSTGRKLSFNCHPIRELTNYEDILSNYLRCTRLLRIPFTWEDVEDFKNFLVISKLMHEEEY